jgi:hypothetical protein
VPHQLNARGIMLCPTGQDQADTRVFIGAGGLSCGDKAAPRAAKSLGVLATVFFLPL